MAHSRNAGKENDMKKVLVILAPGFEEIETVTVVDILRRAGARVMLAGTEDGTLQGSRGIHLVADCGLDAVDTDEYEMVILPGGQPGTSNLQKDARVKAILIKMNQEIYYVSNYYRSLFQIFNRTFNVTCKATSPLTVVPGGMAESTK
jgi:hypothetical protein